MPALYTVPQYVADMVTLIARVTHVPGSDGTVDWFGTSMGGLIGMVLASLPDNPVARLVLNDIGPIIDPGALARQRPDVAARLEEELHGAAEAFEDGGELFHISGARRWPRER